MEQIVDVPVPHILEEIIERVQLIPQDRMFDRTLEQIVGRTLARQIREQTVEVVKGFKGKVGLENYCFTARNIRLEERPKNKFVAGHDEKSEQDALDQLDKNPLAERVVSAAKQRQPHSSKQPSRQHKRKRE